MLSVISAKIGKETIFSQSSSETGNVAPLGTNSAKAGCRLQDTG